MLTISFQGHPKVRAIIIDEPVNGVSGMVECGTCNGGMVLTVLDIEGISGEIEEFIKGHKCLPLTREEEVIAFAERLKVGMPGALIKVKKGQRTVKEL